MKRSKIQTNTHNLNINLGIQGQVKSQVNIKKYFETKERITDHCTNSENKRISVNSGIAATTTSTKKPKNISSIGSFGQRKRSKLKLINSKNTDSETNHEQRVGGTSGSPESDTINIGSARPNEAMHPKRK